MNVGKCSDIFSAVDIYGTGIFSVAYRERSRSKVKIQGVCLGFILFIKGIGDHSAFFPLSSLETCLQGAAVII